LKRERKREKKEIEIERQRGVSRKEGRSTRLERKCCAKF
jgi:hypothetical protein